MVYISSFLLGLLGILIVLITIVISYLKWTYTYWDKKDVETMQPTIPFGNAAPIFFNQKNFSNIWESCYNSFREKGLPYGGAFFFSQRVFVPTDLNLIKCIMQKDFQYFMNRFRYVNEKIDPLSGNIFSLGNAKWKHLREKLSPVYSPAKLKIMFETISAVGDILTSVFEKRVLKNEPVDVKNISSCFIIDIIGSVAYGIEINSLENPNSEFVTHGNLSFRNSYLENNIYLLQNFVPRKYLRLIRYKVTKPEVEKFFMNMVKKTVDFRENNKIYRKDFIQYLLQLKNTGKLTDDGKIEGTKDVGETKLTFNELTAQVYIFFIGGYETSSTTIGFALLELALNSDIQNRLRNEITDVLQKHEGKQTYDSLLQMTYLEKILSETLRKYPPAGDILRYCNKDYQVPDTNLIIERGTMVAISVLGIHMDNDYYPNPTVFDPERFNEENKRTRPSNSWILFGDGPRICIGLTFSMLVTKFAIATIISNFEISLNRKSSLPIKYDTTAWGLCPQDGIWLNLKKIE